MQKMRFKLRFLLPVLFLLVPSVLSAQISSATVSGAVKDPQGAVLPHVKVTATESATDAKTTVETNDAGQYNLPLLKPGTYVITVEVRGFSRYEQKGLILSSGDHPTIDIPLSVGDTRQTVEVSAAAPLLGTEDANIGQVVPGELLENLPLSGRTPMSVAQFTVGVVATTNPVGVRPFDNSAVAGFSVGGLPNKNSEILMDGSPDNASDNAPAYELPLDAAREVSIKVFESDATYGHSGGAVANQITKSGTNGFHGTLSEFHQDSALNAYPYFSKRQVGFKPSVSRQNQFGGTIGGPVIIPKLYNGRDKLFFFFGYEGFYDSGTGGTFLSVPTVAERGGDFSALLAQGTTRTDTECPGVTKTYNSAAIFDPASGTINAACAAKGFTVYDRTPFANNIITSGSIPLNAVALATLKYVPLPNVAGNNVGQANYYSVAESGDRYNNELGRLDFNLSDRQRLYFTGRHNQRVQYLNQFYGASNPTYGDFLYRLNYGYSAGDIITINQSTIAELRLNYTRYSQPSVTNGDGFDPAKLGLPSLPTAHLMFPRFFFNSGSINSLGTTSQTPGTAPFNSYDLFSDVIKNKGPHTIKFGVDIRKFQKGNFTFGNSAGAYNFDNSFTGAFGTSTYSAVGTDTAAFLLGLPSSASYDLNSHAIGNQTYLGLFVQDDWRATPRLTINVGLRMDKDFSPNEREGTAVSGFDTTSINPYSAAATAAYAANPNPTLPVANFKVLGGLTFNSLSNTKFSNFSSTMFSPRIGFAYKAPHLGNDTVIRGGFGIFVIPIFPFNNSINQEGFSQTTQAPIVSYAPPTANGPGTLTNPFPNGLTPPSGSSLGLGTFVGQGITFLDPNIRNGYSERWNLGIQHQFPGGWLLDTFYEGSTGRRLPISQSLNYVERQYLTTASNPALSAAVPNPFYGILPNGGSLNSGKTTNLTQLLQTYPEFGGITEQKCPRRQLHLPCPRRPRGTPHRLRALRDGQLSVVQAAGGGQLPQRVRSSTRVPYLPVRSPHPRRNRRQLPASLWPRTPLRSYDPLAISTSRSVVGTSPPVGFTRWVSPLTFGNVTPTGEAINYNPRAATEFIVNGNTSPTCPSFNINAFINTVTQTAGSNCQLRDAAATGSQPSNNLRTFPSQFANLRNDALNDWDGVHPEELQLHRAHLLPVSSGGVQRQQPACLLRS